MNTINNQYAVDNVIEHQKDLRKTWAVLKKGKASRKHKSNTNSIEQMQDEASERKIHHID